HGRASDRGRGTGDDVQAELSREERRTRLIAAWHPPAMPAAASMALDRFTVSRNGETIYLFVLSQFPGGKPLTLFLKLL
ncbi:hypothetical protein, partial [Mesorhizobium sp. M8A.F.Ca.ET.142.01.1.1]|uniref:hypothetical protein n=1 Tax=Mesorhizobium sp. M8A.F.Ca.ET.142.01.1.1 TaxID=2563958 RepID=UPI001AEE7D9C